MQPLPSTLHLILHNAIAHRDIHIIDKTQTLAIKTITMATDGSLADIRTLDTDPAMLCMRLTENWPDALDRPESTSGVDAAVIVIRHILSGTPIGNIKNPSGNPIVRYAWLDFPDYTEKTKAAVDAERDRLWKGAGKEFPGMSFKDIMESDLMHKTVWQHPALLLFATNPVLRPGHGGKYMDEADAYGEDYSVEDRLSHDSLVVWGGEGELGEAVRRKFGHSTTANGQFLKLDLPGPMGWIRVHYTPSSEKAPTWEDLRHFQLQLQTVEVVSSADRSGEDEDMDEDEDEDRDEDRDDGKGRSRVVECSPRDFALVAVVRMRRDEEDEDLLRVYDPMKGNKPLSSPGVKDPAYLSGNWRLGEPGYTYALFYLRCQGRDLPDMGMKEVYEMPEGFHVREEHPLALFRMLEEVNSPPAGAPTGPRSAGVDNAADKEPTGRKRRASNAGPSNAAPRGRSNQSGRTNAGPSNAARGGQGGRTNAGPSNAGPSNAARGGRSNQAGRTLPTTRSRTKR